MLINMLWSIVFVAVVILQQGCCAPISGESEPDPQKYYGMSEEEYNKLKPCMKKLKAKMENCSEDDITDIKIGDMVYTIQMCQMELARYESETSNSERNQKRNALNFDYYTQSKWTMPIKYLIKTAYFDREDIANIHLGFKLWSQNTCLRFQEVTSVDDPDHRLEIYGGSGGCWSSVGRTYLRQQLNVQSKGCTRIGTIEHEIGHALGLFHEQSRPDRDSYITVHVNNIKPGAQDQFGKGEEPFVITHQVPYDYASVMHYGSKSFTKNGGMTITTKDPNKQHIIGQRGHASFLDYTIVNRMYQCLEPGNAPPTCLNNGLACKNGGFPNPGVPLIGTDAPCSKCLCPLGLKGDCSEAADGHQGCGPLSGTIDVTSTEEQCLTSPNYPTRTYQIGQNCNWILKGPVGSKIMLRFDTTQGFGLLYTPSSLHCEHYVEIKYNGNFTETGPRYCGRTNLLNKIKEVTSTTNEALVIFNSDFPQYYASMMRGFKLCYRLDKLPPSATTTTTTSQPAGSSTIAATTTTVSTTPSTTDGYRLCYRCTSENDENNCFSDICPIDQYCYSVTSWCGGSFKMTKGCREGCLPGFHYKAEDLEMYCCTGVLCNKNQSPPTDTAGFTTTTSTTSAPHSTSSTTITASTTPSTTSTSTTLPPDGYRCYQCTSQRSANNCFSNEVLCPLDQFCYSITSWYGGPLKITKGCRHHCLPGFNHKAKTMERYCCMGDYCNANKSSP